MARSREVRRRRSEREWREVVERFESSGLRLRAFCKRESVALTTFVRWRQQLARDAAPQFLELTPPTAKTSVEGWSIELALPHGVVLRMRSR